MPTPPRSIRITHVLFNASVVAVGIFGLVYIWDPPESETVLRAFGSVFVVFAVTLLILGGYRTVEQGTKHDG